MLGGISMGFKLILIPPTPKTAVLMNEREIQGLEFISKAEKLLRCVICPDVSQYHQTMGRVTSYAINLNSEIATASGLFNQENEVYVTIPNDGLKNFIFHTAERRATNSTKYAVYPYFKSGVVLTSHIDEFAFLDVWTQYGYPTDMTNILQGTCPAPEPVPTPNPGCNFGCSVNGPCDTTWVR